MCKVVGIQGHTLSFGGERLRHVLGEGGVEVHVNVWRDWFACWWVLLGPVLEIGRSEWVSCVFVDVGMCLGGVGERVIVCVVS